MFSATIVRRFVSAAGALTLSALLLAPQDFTAAARALLVATQDGSTSWILAVRASASGARATDFAVARPGTAGVRSTATAVRLRTSAPAT